MREKWSVMLDIARIYRSVIIRRWPIKRQSLISARYRPVSRWPTCPRRIISISKNYWQPSGRSVRLPSTQRPSRNCGTSANSTPREKPKQQTSSTTFSKLNRYSSIRWVPWNVRLYPIHSQNSPTRTDEKTHPQRLLPAEEVQRGPPRASLIKERDKIESQHHQATLPAIPQN